MRVVSAAKPFWLRVLAASASTRTEALPREATGKLTAGVLRQFALAHLDEARLLGRADPDEQRDEHQEGIREEADEAEEQRHRLARGRGDPGRPVVVEARRERGAQDAAAVHRKGGEQIERGEADVGEQDPRRWGRA